MAIPPVTLQEEGAAIENRTDTRTSSEAAGGKNVGKEMGSARHPASLDRRGQPW